MRIRATRNCDLHNGMDTWSMLTGVEYDLPDNAAERAIGEGLAVPVLEDPPDKIEESPDKSLHAEKTRRKAGRRK